MENFSLQNLASKLSSEDKILIIGLGFDTRCLNIANALNDSVSKIIGLVNLHSLNETANNLDSFNEYRNSKIIGNKSISSMGLLDSLDEEISGIANDLLVDITSMSREMLLSLLAYLNAKNLTDRTIFLNNCAESYGDWLSKGVLEVRSILGYSGVLYPSRKLHLVILAGFEEERVMSIVRQFEPNKITIGYGDGNSQISRDLKEKNIGNFRSIKNSLLDRLGYSELDISEFDFSSTDPSLVKLTLEEVLENNFNEYNIIISPLNTKISSLGVGLYALEHNEVQICYAEAEIYNYPNYASPSDIVQGFSI
ncbi:hypothetical protein [Psychrobacter fjordensis]|uniref:hypothetical protein n=1 Tax=Psychrobacter fjordensis TaxID=664424 RepID=UPI0019183564|nr:hypothetical protein [Psychrobacter fjordensis]